MTKKTFRTGNGRQRRDRSRGSSPFSRRVNKDMVHGWNGRTASWRVGEVDIRLKWDPFFTFNTTHEQKKEITHKSFYQHPVPGLGPPPPSHGPITFLITQNGAKDFQNLETSTIQEENWFWNGSRLIDWLGILQMSRDWQIDWLIDWVYSKCHETDKLIDWLIACLINTIDKINSSYGLIGWLTDLAPAVWSIDWLTRASHFFQKKIHPRIRTCWRQWRFGFFRYGLGLEKLFSRKFSEGRYRVRVQWPLRIGVEARVLFRVWRIRSQLSMAGFFQRWTRQTEWFRHFFFKKSKKINPRREVSEEVKRNLNPESVQTWKGVWVWRGKRFVSIRIDSIRHGFVNGWARSSRKNFPTRFGLGKEFAHGWIRRNFRSDGRWRWRLTIPSGTFCSGRIWRHISDRRVLVRR